MMMDHAAARRKAPIFLALQGVKEGVSVFVLAHPNVPVPKMGPCRITQAWTPGGQHVTANIELNSGVRPDELYEKAKKAFSKLQSDVDFWLTPTREKPAVSPADAKDGIEGAHFSVWTEDGLPHPEYDTEPAEAGGGIFKISVRSGPGLPEYFFLQTHSHPNASLFTYLHKTDLLSYDVAQRDDAAYLCPRPIGDWGLHFAYWSFIKHENAHGAYAVAKAILDIIEGEKDERDSALMAVAASHAACIFQPLYEQREVIRGLLKRSAGKVFDCTVMDWIVGCSRNVSPSKWTEHESFERVVAGLGHQKIIASETLRLLINYFSKVDAFLEKRGVFEKRADLAKKFEDVFQLANATVWSSEYLVYRANKPYEPFPDASARDGSKKKPADLLIDAYYRRIKYRAETVTPRKSQQPENRLRTGGGGTGTYRTYSTRSADIQKKWVLIDGTGLVVGRLAAFIVMRLRGKHKPSYTPHMDDGDNVIVINAEKVVLTGRKREKKTYVHHTGFVSGIKELSARSILEGKYPERIVEKAVQRMLPPGPLGRAQFGNLRVYAGSAHPHAAQRPELLDFGSRNRKNHTVSVAKAAAE